MNERIPTATGAVAIDCDADPITGLTHMFVELVQQSRIDMGQLPALRPVFLKAHGSARARLNPTPEAIEILPAALFPASELQAWVRFSSDTVPAEHGYKKTLGLGLKLFDVPGRKLFGDAGDVTLDLIFQNHHVFFLDTASDMCAFTKAAVVDGTIGDYLAAHPTT